MASTIQVDIVSAEEQIFSGEAYMVYAPAVMGEVGIAPRHTPLISPLKPGEVRLVETKFGGFELGDPRMYRRRHFILQYGPGKPRKCLRHFRGTRSLVRRRG